MDEKKRQKPTLAPQTKRLPSVREREALTHKEYNELLHSRSPAKQLKLADIKQQLIAREFNECTFAPQINKQKSTKRYFEDKENIPAEESKSSRQ